MSALRILATATGRSVGVAQELYLVLVPHGGQAGARANAVRAIARDTEYAQERRRAQVAMLAALTRHPSVHGGPRSHAPATPTLVAAHG